MQRNDSQNLENSVNHSDSPKSKLDKLLKDLIQTTNEFCQSQSSKNNQEIAKFFQDLESCTNDLAHSVNRLKTIIESSKKDTFKYKLSLI